MMSETVTDILALDRVGLWGLLDIAIVSVLIYELLKVVRRTHPETGALGTETE